MFVDDLVKSYPEYDGKIEGIINLQNVQDYCVGLPDKIEKRMEDALFNGMVPFKTTLFEYRLSKLHIGIIATNSTYSEYENCLMLKYYFYNYVNKSASYIGESVVVLNKDGSVKTDENGMSITGKSIGSILMSGDNELKKVAMMIINSYTIFAALNFLYCKNVVLAEKPMDIAYIKSRQRRNKPYFEKTHTIAIEPMKKVLDEEGHAQSIGVRQAFHICRGHFRTYDDNSKGLFGKHHGTFWVPAHTRGDTEIGKIKKDYEIKVPEHKE